MKPDGGSAEDPETNEIKTFAFFDLETTGLPDIQFNKTKITELTIIGVSVAHFLEHDFPRVQHKLKLCFNPFKRIDLKAEEVTGLSNELLEHESKLDKNTMNLLECFLYQLQQPVCLIAHNGKRFDFPLLKKQLEVHQGTFPASLKCCDSLPVFKKVDEFMEKKAQLLTESFSLQQWEDLKDDEILMSEEVLRLLEGKPNSKPIDDGSDQVLHALVEQEIVEIEKNEKQEPKSFQAINEKTPEQKAPRPVNLQPHAQHSNDDRTPKPSVKRDLFPKTSPRKAAKQTRKSFALREIYKRFFLKYPDASHDAESDVIAIMQCASACKKDFVELVGENCASFEGIKKF